MLNVNSLNVGDVVYMENDKEPWGKIAFKNNKYYLAETENSEWYAYSGKTLNDVVDKLKRSCHSWTVKNNQEVLSFEDKNYKWEEINGQRCLVPISLNEDLPKYPCKKRYKELELGEVFDLNAGFKAIRIDHNICFEAFNMEQNKAPIYLMHLTVKDLNNFNYGATGTMSENEIVNVTGKIKGFTLE